MTPHILLVDDDTIIQKLVGKFISSFGYTFDIASNGREALERLEGDRFHILLSDLEMPEMDGRELVLAAGDKYPNMLNIIMSVVNDVERVVSILNEYKVYDYLIKPFSEKVLKNSIDKAFEAQRLRLKATNLTIQENCFFKDFVKTVNWKNELLNKKTESIAQNLIHQMNIGFFHGEGIGSLLTIVGLILNRAKFDDLNKTFGVPENQFNLLRDSYDTSQDMVQCFNQAQTILMQDVKYTEREKISTVRSYITDWCSGMRPFLRIKNQKISVSAFPPTVERYEIAFNREKMKIVIEELLVNAMKYSRDSEKFYLIFFHRNDYLEFKILNPAYKEGDTLSISKKNENTIFEPFYRLSTVKDDRFSKELFGYGLGLTVVKKIIDLHGANIFIYTITNHKDKDRGRDVCVTLRFPLL